ncbi:hypothetical protein [Methylocystis heyeri]|uniref:Uncharacterized protein n=1 Tax=Methylocystis heyeri TaxID=391905 RepID=A0A6B8KGF4_9HYPH|nr:hypothetical protein [Methylocystis heyeri]QGM47454.1 hypothetical protein H2LOC_018145 [Methylocystis heyeri]
MKKYCSPILALLALLSEPVMAQQSSAAGAPQSPGPAVADPALPAIDEIPGYYDPATGTFAPLKPGRSPARNTPTFTTTAYLVIFPYVHHSEGYGSITCSARITYVSSDRSKPAATLTREAKPNEGNYVEFDVDAGGDTRPMGTVTVQCTGYDGSGRSRSASGATFVYLDPRATPYTGWIPAYVDIAFP